MLLRSGAIWKIGDEREAVRNKPGIWRLLTVGGVEIEDAVVDCTGDLAVLLHGAGG